MKKEITKEEITKEERNKEFLQELQKIRRTNNKSKMLHNNIFLEQNRILNKDENRVFSVEEIMLIHKKLKIKINTLTSKIREVEKANSNIKNNFKSPKIIFEDYVLKVLDVVGKIDQKLDDLLGEISKTRRQYKEEIKRANTTDDLPRKTNLNHNSFQFNERMNNQMCFEFKMQIKLLDSVFEGVGKSKSYIRFIHKNTLSSLSKNPDQVLTRRDI